MAAVIPFKGILYNSQKVQGDEAVSPPYDIVTPEFKEVLYQRSPFNIVRIDFGKEMPDDSESVNRYTRARDYFEQWLKEGILKEDESPCFYACEMDYQLYGEGKRIRGILALVKIEELGEGVYPHEETHSKPKSDRLNLLKTCLANISPIYSLYNSPEKVTSDIIANINEKPCFSATDPNGDKHTIYRISDESKIEMIKRELSNKPVFIADGHHRYEVALEFKRQMNRLKGRGPWDYVLMFLANMSDEGIAILPTHRLVKGFERDNILQRLGHDFDIYELSLNSDIIKNISLAGKKNFGLYLEQDDHWYMLKYKGGDLKDLHPAMKDLDVVVLHEVILKKDLGITDVAYEMGVEEAMKRVHRGEFNAAFFLNPTGVEDVERVAMSGLRMPPKSTYFYPKLLTGLVIYKFREQ